MPDNRTSLTLAIQETNSPMEVSLLTIINDEMTGSDTWQDISVCLPKGQYVAVFTGVLATPPDVGIAVTSVNLGSSCTYDGDDWPISKYWTLMSYV